MVYCCLEKLPPFHISLTVRAALRYVPKVKTLSDESMMLDQELLERSMKSVMPPTRLCRLPFDGCVRVSFSVQS